MSALTSLSFYSLDEAKKNEVLACVAALPESFTPEKGWPIDGRALITNRVEYATTRDVVQQFVDRLEPIGFRYLSEDEATRYEHELAFAYYIAMGDCQLAVYDRNYTKLKEDVAFLERVGGVLEKLRHRNDIQIEPPCDKDIPTRYLGYMMISPYFVEIIRVNSLEPIKEHVAYPAALNDGRLYLVWTAEMVSQMCTILNNKMRNISIAVAESILGVVTDITGALGWILYFMRGGIEVGLLIQNTVDMKGTCFEWIWPESLQVSDEVRKLNVPRQDKWRGQWKERSFIILNDSVWGGVNFLCFFVLVGSGALGYWGDVLNGALFLFDLWHSHKTLLEAQTDHELQVIRFDIAIMEIKEKIDALDSESALCVQSTFGLEQLIKAKKKLIRDWGYKQKDIQLDIVYAGTLMLAFAVLCSLFIPGGFLAPMSIMMFALVGSTMCFLLGVVYEAMRTDLKLDKLAVDTEASFEDYSQYLQLFKATDVKDDDKRRLIFLEMYKSLAETKDQKNFRHYQLAKMWTKVLTDMLIPVLFIATFVFMPVTFGATAFALGMAVILMAKWQSRRLMPDETEALEEFPEDAYKAFCIEAAEDTPPEALTHFFKLPAPEEDDAGSLSPEPS